MNHLKFFVLSVFFAVFIFSGCGGKKEETTATAKPAQEFLSAKLICVKDANSTEDMEIQVKSLLESLDRGDWKQVNLDAGLSQKFTVAWEYVMEQGGGKAISYFFGLSKENPSTVVLYKGTETNGGASKDIDPQLVYAKIKAMAEQLKSSK